MGTARLVRSRFVTLFLVALLGLSFAFAQTTELRVWFGRENFIPADRFETFHEEHPDIRVNFEVVRLEDVATQLILAQRAGEAPDLVQISSYIVPQLAEDGLLQDATALIDRWEAEYPDSHAALAPITWDAATHDGAIYGASLFNQSMYLFYRADWLEEAGIDQAPRTRDDVLDAARAIRETAPDRYGFSVIGSAGVPPVWELPLFMSLGGEFIDGVPQLDSEAGYAFIDFYQTLMREDLIHPDSLAWDPGEMRAAVIGGQAAMMIEGEHLYVPIHDEMPYAEGRWDFTLLPHRAGAEAAASYVTFGFPYVVTAATDETNALLEVLEYLARKDSLMEVALTYQPTSNLEVSADPAYLEAKPWAPDILPLFEQVVPLPAHPDHQLELMDVFVELRQETLANPTADPEAVAERYQEMLDEVASQ